MCLNVDDAVITVNNRPITFDYCYSTTTTFDFCLTTFFPQVTAGHVTPGHVQQKNIQRICAKSLQHFCRTHLLLLEHRRFSERSLRSIILAFMMLFFKKHRRLHFVLSQYVNQNDLRLQAPLNEAEWCHTA